MNHAVDKFGLRRHLPPDGIAVRPEWILFIHGMWEAGGIFDGIWEDEEKVFPPFIEPFLEAGYRCAVQLLPGYCRAQRVKWRGGVRFGQYLTFVRSAYNDLGRPIVIGHSLGGLLAQKLIEEAAPRAAVLLAPAAPNGIRALQTKELWKFAFKYLHRIALPLPLLPSKKDMDRFMLNGLSEEQSSKLYEKLQSASGFQTLQISNPLRGIPVRVNPEIPVYVAYGERDKITPPETAIKVAAKYGVTAILCKDRAHMLTLEDGWETVARDILAWLESIPKRKPAG